MLMGDERADMFALLDETASSPSPSPSFLFCEDDDDSGSLSIDIDSFLDILNETPPPPPPSPGPDPDPDPYSSQSRAEEFLDDAPQGFPFTNGASSSIELLGSDGFSTLFNSEASESRLGVSDGSSESVGNSVILDSSKLESSSQFGSPVHSCAGSLADWIPSQSQGHFCKDEDYVYQNSALSNQNDAQYEMPNCSGTSGTSRFTSSNLNLGYDGNISGFSQRRHAEYQLNFMEQDTNSAYLSQNQLIPSNKVEIFTAQKTKEYFSREVDASPDDVTDMPSNLQEIPDSISGDDKTHLLNMGKSSSCTFSSHDFYSSGSRTMRTHSENMIKVKDEGKEFLFAYGSSSNGATLYETMGNENKAAMRPLMPCNSRTTESFINCNDSESAFVKSIGGPVDKLIESSFYVVPSVVDGENQFCAKEPVTQLNSSFQSPRVANEGVMPYSADFLTSIHSEDNVVYAMDGKEDILLESKRPRWSSDIIGYASARSPSVAYGHKHRLDLQLAENSGFPPSCIRDKQFAWPKAESDMNSLVPMINSGFSESSRHAAIPGSGMAERSEDDDGDVCIIEDISEPASTDLSITNARPLVCSQFSKLSDPFIPIGVGHTRMKGIDDRFMRRMALQDFSQPRTEESPPDGVLSVPLLRHQRIALSWMVKKEKNIYPCCGGILADDQGLGKTISTIALILKERSPSSRVPTVNTVQSDARETLNIDDDSDDDAGDGAPEIGKSKQNSKSCQAKGNFLDAPVEAKGRPAAGTLIVCPTSVLRQWSDELQNKVTREAGLSVLVYHGSNRTKDPLELAKHDIVLTTYSIVSMEVPKQPLGHEDADETGRKADGSPVGHSPSNKRKYPSGSNKKPLRGKKGMDNELLETFARPLARVGWFRVVLDEAQSIKNHRTQVARACWGLRAKRRWCLSGTPIQNAVDDLYSYFRFLRYEKLMAYKVFCSAVKVPIQKNPLDGYRRLQMVLKTVMLRRTKGTLFDGEPIITLPPKTIELKKVDFTKEERDFYCRLEADSRAQFAEYAAAGTVKQNYVNILLMLLRLRQACDHPLLVRGSFSNSIWKSSVEMAMKIPREKQICLLNCLEASLAICGICNDPPEDAVVTICGHVFCNQCICEHLTGDDTKCPTRNCKAQLGASSIFSTTTLRSALAVESKEISDSSVPVKAETAEPSPDSLYDSSKIKAALQVLQSLSKRRDNDTGKNSSSVDGGVCNNSSAGYDLDDREYDIKKSDMVTVVGEKAIVFSQWTRMLDLLEACLKNSSIQYRRLDGTMSVTARDKAVKDFNTCPEVSVMIMSLKAASLGLNMVAACHVLLLDLWWNPTTEDQAIDRAHRIGQTRPVKVLRLTVRDTVEDRILALQQKKRKMVASAFGEDGTGGHQTRLTVEDLNFLFG